MSQARRKCRDCGALGPWKVYMIADLKNPNWEPPKRGKHWQCPKCDELPKSESDGREPVVEGNMGKAAGKTVVVLLKKSAKTSAVSRGHDMKRFRKDGYWANTCISECRTCGMTVYVVRNPALNETNIFGPAVAQNCDGGKS